MWVSERVGGPVNRVGPLWASEMSRVLMKTPHVEPAQKGPVADTRAVITTCHPDCFVSPY